MGEKAGTYTVDAHFEGKPPQVRKVYDRLLKAAGAEPEGGPGASGEKK